MSNGMGMIFQLEVGLIIKISLIKMSCFAPYSHSKNKIEVELDLSNYATKSGLISATRVDP